MRWATSSQEPAMTLKVKVKLGRVGNVAVYDGPGRTIPTSIGIAFTCREEPDVMALAHDDERDLGFDVQITACFLKLG